MKNFIGKSLLTAATTLISLSAFAIEPDELRGEVVAINEDESSITLKLIEVGEGFEAPVDSVHTFTINEDTEIQDDFVTEVLDDDLGDIQVSEIVTLEIDESDLTMATSVLRHSDEA